MGDATSPSPEPPARSAMRWSRAAAVPSLVGGRDSDQAFLDDRGDEAAVTPEDLAARQPTCPGCGWGLLEVQQPLVGAERPVEPHGVIQTGPRHAVLVLGQ